MTRLQIVELWGKWGIVLLVVLAENRQYIQSRVIGREFNKRFINQDVGSM